ncbi:hypothetical protein V5799_022325 [Amblyomma americanum]|uniref:Fibronectin type-III domain-containing protein n=1 Tax=Amblyomma americanum TaxID=6943 RepID=A0AAQ4FL66_AMBAM
MSHCGKLSFIDEPVPSLIATSEQLAVTWLPPYPPHGILQSYLVRYKLVEESEFRKHLVLTSEEAVCEGEARERQYCARISGLIANRRYDVAVIAKNEDVQAWSEESNSVTAETRESIHLYADQPQGQGLNPSPSSSLRLDKVIAVTNSSFRQETRLARAAISSTPARPT